MATDFRSAVACEPDVHMPASSYAILKPAHEAVEVKAIPSVVHTDGAPPPASAAPGYLPSVTSAEPYLSAATDWANIIAKQLTQSTFSMCAMRAWEAC
eukprot:CAMPEP_0119304186 /NCGR_PEP_ID=MMETSP1333-20130426/5481_1 /TAXON_ID=418940 /ORGANISM="Scyphosphaera apsteinii, Strain RCC1455" /LENGTH=97 /DNA_ID=CAMNT_0007307033 /DNA_START=271 /DNA_END=562 /DNA_ORIENTATION=-